MANQAGRSCEWFIETDEDSTFQTIMDFVAATEHEFLDDRDGDEHRVIRCTHKELVACRNSAASKQLTFKVWRRQGHHRSPIARCPWEEPKLVKRKPKKKVEKKPIEF